jgi:glyoxylase-like metal-dependent hydrolase (beta-lactamase superfamily II)
VFTEIAPDVFAVAHRLVDGKNTIVFGARGRALDRLAITHGHGDHVLGSGGFRGADVYAHLAAPHTIDRNLPQWADRYFDGSRSACEAALSRPNVLFDRELRIDLGGKKVRMFAAPGHFRTLYAFSSRKMQFCAPATRW